LFDLLSVTFSETRESYNLIKEQKTWYEAQQYCKANYTDLVSIKNNDENKKIKEKANGTAVWIGLFNNPWKWSDGGGNYTFQNWSENQPDNYEGKEKCVMIKKITLQLNDDQCSKAYPFFCYNESCTNASCTKYHFEGTFMNWSAAQTYCRDKYVDLATINSQEEAKQLSDMTNISVDAWIGMYHDAKENWRWSNGDDVTYNMRRVKSFCATISPDGQWNSYVCHNKKQFMCYNNNETSERYILITELKTWYEAQQYCRRNHTDLVSIKNEDENNKIKEKANGAAVWIGLFNNPWKWSDGGGNYTFQNWSENQPDNYEGKEKCVKIQNNSNTLQLNDDQCSKAHPFFCYDNALSRVPLLDTSQSTGLEDRVLMMEDIAMVTTEEVRVWTDGKKLFLVKQNKTWVEAIEYCRANHTDLVSIESEQELNRVYQEANKASSSHVWLGLLQSCTFGFWYWVDGAQSCYDNWAPEPRCQAECNPCGVMTARNGSKWIKKPCTEQFNFICYNGKLSGFVFCFY
ncbi:MRC1 protein, partial [Polyodon spathula]|nr:MRC1 protein [Polyodon spathula]